MEIEFDPWKSRRNRKKHGLWLAEAEHLDWESMIAWIDDSEDYGEERWVGIAPLKGTLLHTVVFVEINQDYVRVISLRLSTRREFQIYAAKKGH